MKIDYRTFDEYIPVDIDKLRPGGSYGKLIEKRTHPIDNLIKEHGRIPDGLLLLRNCPTCESDDFSFECEKDHLRIVRCNCCNLVYVNPVFNEDHYKKLYQSEEFQHIMSDLGIDSHNYRVNRFGKERVSIMKKYIAPSQSKEIKYLDVGCSTGFVVEAAMEEGWDAMGLDLNPSAVAFGRKRGLVLEDKALEDASLNLDSFDAISLFEVLEHITNPKEIMEKAISLLKKNGIMFIYVPNYDSASRFLMGVNAHFIWPTHHLNYYTLKTLAYLLEQFGLKVEYLVTEGLDIADYLWYKKNVLNSDAESIREVADYLQFFINAGGYGKNLRIIARKTS